MAATVSIQQSELAAEMDAILQRLRWIASMGTYGPDAAAVAEKSDMAQDLTCVIIEKASKEAGQWSDSGPSSLVLSKEIPGVPA